MGRFAGLFAAEGIVPSPAAVTAMTNPEMQRKEASVTAANEEENAQDRVPPSGVSHPPILGRRAR
jgi:hypothetical protein